jgi:hypothetical protein
VPRETELNHRSSVKIVKRKNPKPGKFYPGGLEIWVENAMFDIQSPMRKTTNVLYKEALKL